MFERFTEQSRQIVVLAQEEARQLQHNYIGTEHFLLAISRHGGRGARALEAIGVNYDRVSGEVLRIVGRGEGRATDAIPFTPRSKALLERSLKESLSLNDDAIESDHILLGLVNQGEGVAVAVLDAFGASAEAVRDQVLIRHEESDVPGFGAERPLLGDDVARVLDLARKAAEQDESPEIRLDHLYRALAQLPPPEGSGTKGSEP